MNVWFVPVWVVPMIALVTLLVVALAAIARTHRALKSRVGALTDYTEAHNDDLQQRVEVIRQVTAQQRRSLTQSIADTDQISRETRALNAVRDVEMEGKRDALQHHPG